MDGMPECQRAQGENLGKDETGTFFWRMAEWLMAGRRAKGHSAKNLPNTIWPEELLENG